MSDDAPRGITGLAPRKVDPKSMLARNRPTTAPEAAVPVEAAPTASQSPAPAPETPRRPKTARKPATAPKNEQGRVNTYIDPDVRSRVVATYKATAHLEGDESFSAFVETALLNESIRREQLHNDGEPFAASGQLQRGRPVRG
ncbi:ParB family protein [Microbacterium flavum]|uniref:ParB family protein n=1 Tax=Microbacterium flavum TaxID=415216 RepID=UPI0024AD6019|nr:hypothetical protein [Microbacterium flavum]